MNTYLFIYGQITMFTWNFLCVESLRMFKPFFSKCESPHYITSLTFVLGIQAAKPHYKRKDSSLSMTAL